MIRAMGWGIRCEGQERSKGNADGKSLKNGEWTLNDNIDIDPEPDMRMFSQL